MLILVALFLFGANDISDQEKSIMTVIIMLILALAILLTIFTVGSEYWKRQGAKAFSKVVRSKVEVARVREIDHLDRVEPLDLLSNNKFLSRFQSCIAKELLAYEFFLFAKYNESKKSGRDDNGSIDLDELRVWTKGCPETVLNQLKFVTSWSLAQHENVKSVKIGSAEIDCKSFHETLCNYPGWYLDYLWNRLVCLEKFVLSRDVSKFGE